MFICRPVSLLWENAAEFGGPKCFNILAFNYYNAAFFILSDLFLAAAPIMVLKDMQMNKKRKSNCVMPEPLSFVRSKLTVSSASGLHVQSGYTRDRGDNLAPSDKRDRYQQRGSILVRHERVVSHSHRGSRGSRNSRYWAPAELCSVLESSLGIVFVCVPAIIPLFSNVMGSAAKKSGQEDIDLVNSRNPDTFGKMGRNPKRKIELGDETLLRETRLTDLGGHESDVASQRSGYDLEECGKVPEHNESTRG